MAKYENFWAFYDEVETALQHRCTSFRQMFEHLDKFEGPITIVETGCTRDANNWSGDGCSTVLFDKYVNARNDGSGVKTVDISPRAVSICKSLVSDKTEVVHGDSVSFLHEFVLVAERKNINVPLFYLDSFDLDWTYWQPSAIHHLKELTSIHHFLKPETMVVVDDCMQNADFVLDGAEATFRKRPEPGGKGRLFAEYAKTVGAKLEFSSYQAGWTGFNRAAA